MISYLHRPSQTLHVVWRVYHGGGFTIYSIFQSRGVSGISLEKGLERTSVLLSKPRAYLTNGPYSVYTYTCIFDHLSPSFRPSSI